MSRSKRLGQTSAPWRCRQASTVPDVWRSRVPETHHTDPILGRGKTFLRVSEAPLGITAST